MKAVHALALAFCILQPLRVSADSPPNATAMQANPCAPALEAPRDQSEAGVKSGDWANLCRYHQVNGALSAPTRVVFMGDSITEGWVQADSGLFKEGIVGRGISGQTSPQMLLRFFQDVIDLHPQVVHIMAGTNDVAGNTGPTSEKDFENNVRAMVELAQVHHIRVALASIPPASAFPWQPSLRPAQTIQHLNAWLHQYARETHSRYIDYYAALNDGQGGFKPNLSNDGVHPNSDGYAVMRKLAQEGIK